MSFFSAASCKQTLNKLQRSQPISVGLIEPLRLAEIRHILGIIKSIINHIVVVEIHKNECASID